MKTPEGYEKDDICKYLDRVGVWFFRPFAVGYGKSGVPDIICCARGAFLAIEVKREGKEPTPRQKFRIAEIRRAGGVTAWGTAAKVIPEIEAWLKTISIQSSCAPASSAGE